MSGREHLPARRLHENDHSLIHDGVHFHVGLGRAAGSRRILEVFIKPGGRSGRASTFERICDDVAVALSYLLRSGTPPSVLASAFGRQGGLPGQPDAETREPSSFIGAVADLVAARQRELDVLPVDALFGEVNP